MENFLNDLKEKFKDNELTIDDRIEILLNDDMEIELENIIDNNLSSNFFQNDICNINDSLFIDLEILYDNLQNKENSILTKINKTNTLFGKCFLKNRLLNPTFDINYLNKQKDNIQKFIPKIDLFEDQFKLLKNTEKDLLWFWRDSDEHIESIYNMIFFENRFLKFINSNKIIMFILNIYKMFLAPCIAIFSPLSTFIFLFIAYKYYKIQIPFSKLVELCKTLIFNKFGSGSKLKMMFSLLIWLFFYGQGIYQCYLTSNQINKISNIFHEKLNIVNNCLQSCKKLFELKNENNIELLTNELNFDEFKLIIQNSLYKTNPKLFNNKGDIFSTYYILLDIKDKLKPFLLFLSEIDYYYSISSLYNEFQNKNNKYCLPNYIDSKTLNLSLDKAWHPYLINKPVCNSIKLNKNIIITGPNAAGKSTFIKTVLLNVLFSQTISIAPSSNIEISLFKNLESYLHIPDTKGKESLFEAEMNKSLNYINNLKENKNEKSLIIMDELFSSTNNKEGIEAAKIVCQQMGKHKNNLTLLTTHYEELSLLEKETKRFLNYKFIIRRNENHDIVFTYKLKRGISKDFIALELFSKKMNSI